MKKRYTLVLMACYLSGFAPLNAAQEQARTTERRHHGGQRGHHRRPDGRHHQKGHNRGHHRRPHHDGHHGRRYGHHRRPDGRHHRFIPRDPARRRLFCERHPRTCQRRGIVIPGVIAAATPRPGQEALVNPPATEVIIDTALTEHAAIEPEEQGYTEAEEEVSPAESLGQSYFEDEDEEEEEENEAERASAL